MWLQRFTKHLLEKRWQTLLLVSVLAFIPVLSILSLLIATLVTLRKSIAEGAALFIIATLPVIGFFNQPQALMPLVIWTVIGFSVLSNALTWVFAVMIKRRMTFSAVLQIGALVCVLVISIIHLLYPDIANWWGTQLQAYYAQAKNIAGDVLKNPPAATPATGADMQAETINATKYYATGFVMAGIFLKALIQLIWARWWQATVFNPGSLRRELQHIRLSPLAGFLFAVSLVLYYLGNSVVLDIMPVLYVLFGAAGLSLIHYVFRLMQSPTRWFWLVLLYVTLILSMPISLLLVAVIALMDIWLDMRRRVSKV